MHRCILRCRRTHIALPTPRIQHGAAHARPLPLPPTAPTVIIDQRFDEALKRAVPDDPTWSVLSFPLRGNYCLFSGDLGHGVLDGGDDWADRITLLVNWWDHQPEAVGPAPLGETILANDDAETVQRGKQLPIPVVDAASSEEELQLVSEPREMVTLLQLSQASCHPVRMSPFPHTRLCRCKISSRRQVSHWSDPRRATPCESTTPDSVSAPLKRRPR